MYGGTMFIMSPTLPMSSRQAPRLYVQARLCARSAMKKFIVTMGSGFLLLMILFALVACNGSASGATAKGLQVVAGENFWGSIATQLGGEYATVTSLVKSPTGDPHDYESTTDDARAVAQAQYVILNGAGYDDWGKKMLDANP